MQHALDFLSQDALYLLLDWRGSESENLRSSAVGVLRLKLMVKEVAHDQIVKVILISVMALVKYDQIDFLHFCKAVHQ